MFKGWNTPFENNRYFSFEPNNRRKYKKLKKFFETKVVRFQEYFKVVEKKIIFYYFV